MAITIDSFPLLEAAPARLSRGVRSTPRATVARALPAAPAGMSWVVSRSATTGKPGAYLYTEYGAEAVHHNANSLWFRAVVAPRMVRKATRITEYVKRMDAVQN
ncbi:hypothetical protein ACFDTO_17555 [Microbacteriaceae bacterium 4G12]